MSVETWKSYGDRGSDENQVKSLDTCRELSGIALFNFGEIEQPKYAYAIIPLACMSKKDKDGNVTFDVRKARSRVIREEAKSYPNNVRCYYQSTGMCREPVFEAFVEDFIEDENLITLEGDKLLSLDQYDSHIQRAALRKLFDSGTFAIFTENDCTDILSMPDAGGISTLKKKIGSIVDVTVEDNISAQFGNTPASKSLKRKTLL